MIAVLGGLPNGVGDRVGLLGGKASAGQPAGDGMTIKHEIMLLRAPRWTAPAVVVERERTRQVARIGNNLNQLARWANTPRRPGPEPQR